MTPTLFASAAARPALFFRRIRDWARSARPRVVGAAIVASLALGALPAAASVVPGGMVSHQTNATGSANSFEVTLTVESAPPDDSNLYWAQQFYTSTTVDHQGYVGLQTGGNILGVPTGKIAVFSIWNADAAEAGPGATAQTFDGEGIGYSVRIPLAWKAGVGYRFQVQKDGALWWKVNIVDSTTGTSTYVGRIRITQDVPLQPVWVGFTEYYSSVASCASVPYARVTFSSIVFGGKSYGTSPPITYGNCASNARASRRADGTAVHEVGLQAADFSNTVSNVITGYYQTILGRTPDAGGMTFWQGEVSRMRGLGANVNEVFYAMALAFFNSTEYTSRNTGDTQYLTDLYRTFFVREPDAGGVAFWQGQLTSGVPRLAVLNSFLFSTEFQTFMTNAFGSATASRAEVSVVIDFYRGLLGRLPDTDGFNAWLTPFRKAQCQGAAAVNAQVESISQQFIASGEYSVRTPSRFTVAGAALYVADLYNAFLKRPVDALGYQNWVNQTASGSLTREQARKAFVASAEFQGKVAAIISQGCLP